ncbi:Ankyrin-2 [Xylographa opegraphella]|nr:Ankyrin-2 [Xylographa opegraphella]
MSTENVSVSHHAHVCIYLFKATSSHLRNSYQEYINHQEFLDEYGRYNLWLQDSGAVRVGRRSLDHRLAESTYISGPVLYLVKDLRQALEEVLAIVSDKRPQRTYELQESAADVNVDELSISSNSTDSDFDAQSPLGLNPGPTTELHQLFLAINETINSLFRLSYLVQDPRPRDRYTQNTSTTSLNESYDIDHVWNQYPYVRSTTWLLRRLGKANARRRQFFRNADARLEQRAQAQGLPIEDEAEPTQLNNESVTVATQNPSTLFSVAQRKTNSAISFVNNDDFNEDDVRSVTSYGTSVNSENKMFNRIPPPPRESINGRPFESTFKRHLTVSHHDLYTEPQLPFLMMKCESSIRTIPANACPFCNNDSWTTPSPDLLSQPATGPENSANLVSLKQFRSHVGRHMEDLALFVLPQRYDAENSISSSSDNSDTDNDSESDTPAIISSKRDRMGRTSLARACAAQRVDEVWRLIAEFPQELDAADYAGNTPLQIASSNGNIEIVEALLDSGCGTKCRNKVWNTPLMEAAMHGHSSVVFRLIAASISADERNADGKTAIDMLDASVADYEIIKTALTYAGIDVTKTEIAEAEQTDNNGWESDKTDTPITRQLIVAVGTGAEAEAEKLLESGGDPDAKHFRERRTKIRALDVAAIYNHSTLIPLLIRYGANIKLVNPVTPIILVANSLVEPLRLLLENGLDINVPCLDLKPTALSCAALSGQVEIVRLLLAFGADPNREIPMLPLWPPALPALHHAASTGNEEIVELLLASGADIQLRSCFGTSALHHAASSGQCQMIRLLVRHGAHLEVVDDGRLTPLLNAIKHHKVEACKLLCSLGASTNSNPARQGALSYAAEQGQLPIVQYLLDEGADIDTCDTGLGTPLHHAAALRLPGMIQFLLQKGANISIRNVRGKTALDFVVQSGAENLAKVWSTYAVDRNPTSSNDADTPND